MTERLSPGEYQLHIANGVLQIAVKAVLRSADVPDLDAPAIGDHVGGDVEIAVIATTPAACAAALHQDRSDITSILCEDDLHLLPRVVGAQVVGCVVHTLQVVRLADAMPPLTMRQRSVMEALLAGTPLRRIARAMDLSEATIKREIATCVDLFDVAGKSDLVVAALRIGLGPSTTRSDDARHDPGLPVARPIPQPAERPVTGHRSLEAAQRRRAFPPDVASTTPSRPRRIASARDIRTLAAPGEHPSR